MTAIAITHEIGTHGHQVALRLAQRLGIDYADPQFLENRITDRSARDNRLWGGRTDSGAGFGRYLRADDRRLAGHARAEIGELAAYGRIVMRGWGAASLLRDNPHVFRIRLWAPTSFRLRVLAARERGSGEAALRRLIENSDECLATNLQPIVGTDWRADKFYHAVLCTSLQPVEDCAEELERLITNAWMQPARLFLDESMSGAETKT